MAVTYRNDDHVDAFQARLASAIFKLCDKAFGVTNARFDAALRMDFVFLDHFLASHPILHHFLLAL